ncbi:unnamed protein product [Parnassius mnemosyne]|uniref:Phosphatidylinositol-glycan biosynthesis class W protein n=1 Tax=Parnassius mnemosyne TaxID=213953 RepID=A0AAV1M7S1_9NEOP
MNATEYKKYHESFMENNHGTTALHTFFSLFFTVQTSLLCCIRPKNPKLVQYSYEYISIVLSMILAHTIFVDNIYVMNFVAFAFITFEFLKTHSIADIQRTFSKLNSFGNTKIISISCTRGLTYLMTVFCILAVDFQDFPRYLAKTEKYGYSLMDTGVGLFVLMSGLVHKDVSKESCTSIIKGNSKFISVLISLGFLRYFSVKQLDYHEHVTEYGVHWNFFFTLATLFTPSYLTFIILNMYMCLTIGLNLYLKRNGIKI